MTTMSSTGDLSKSVRKVYFGEKMHNILNSNVALLIYRLMDKCCEFSLWQSFAKYSQKM